MNPDNPLNLPDPVLPQNQQSAPVSPQPVVAPPNPLSTQPTAVTTAVPIIPPTTPAVSLEYASVGNRMAANFLDGLIVGAITAVPTFLISLVLGLLNLGGSFSGVPADSPGMVAAIVGSNIISFVISLMIHLTYYIYFIGKKGQTWGKMALKIKVVKKDTGNPPGYGGAFLREYVGKAVSSLVLGIGYLAILWDKEKQGWHDKIAGTIVIKTQ